ncbi:TetR/AcrR family transcriptional regulator [Streptomyces fuscichromogenes]|uniref:TetR family transcriptional regulator n=1 Tax=Streptomyces fuscichromogenes TaxID=1324013 RepID=A0A917XI47_9ACTN|nr:TetR/AcrR family transcriptional regulator [Streptomyces fuscichromogenes]GGN28064.1 TetR family transcriptional regulator [Streptomyces fuscichromogenes]
MIERSRPSGLSSQMERTRSAILTAARDLADTGAEITMPAVAAEARVSEATAYRYFPDLFSLLRAAVMTEDLVAVLRSATRGDDPVERIGQAAEILGRAVLRRQGAVRVVVASTIAKPSTAKDRPARRFGLIEHALAPWADRCGSAHRADVEQLVRGLVLVVSAESLFALTDLCGLSPDDAIASLVTTARQMTAAAVAAIPAGPATD